MFGGNRKVKPQRQQHENENNIADSNSDSNETISSLAYALRKVRKTGISRTCDKEEIEFIEKRFEDTSKVIFQELDKRNSLLLKKSLKYPLRSDLVAVEGRQIQSSLIFTNSSVPVEESKNTPSSVPVTTTITDVWDGNGNGSTKQQGTRKQKANLSVNAVTPETMVGTGSNRNRPSKKGLCRVS